MTTSRTHKFLPSFGSAVVLLATVALLIGLVISAACTPPAAVDESDNVAERPVPVEVANVERADVQRRVVGNTTLRAGSEVSIVAEVPGTASGVAVEVGDTVTAGMTLVRVDNDDTDNAVRESRTAIRHYEEQLARLEPLLEEGLIPRTQVDELRFQLEVAENNLRRARSGSGMQTVHTPIAGVVVRRDVEDGEIVIPNRELFAIADLNVLEAEINVPERELLTLRVGQEAQIEVAALADRQIASRVSWISPLVDPQTGTVTVRAEVTGGALLGDGTRLRPGMFVNVAIATETRTNALVIPKRAVIYEADRTVVAVVREQVEIEVPELPETDEAADEGDEDETEDSDGPPAPQLPAYAYERVEVELGFDHGDQIEVLSGLTDADRVVVVGQDGLDPEARITIPGDASAVAAEPDDG